MATKKRSIAAKKGNKGGKRRLASATKPARLRTLSANRPGLQPIDG